MLIVPLVSKFPDGTNLLLLGGILPIGIRSPEMSDSEQKNSTIQTLSNQNYHQQIHKNPVHSAKGIGSQFRKLSSEMQRKNLLLMLIRWMSLIRKQDHLQRVRLLELGGRTMKESIFRIGKMSIVVTSQKKILPPNTKVSSRYITVREIPGKDKRAFSTYGRLKMFTQKMSEVTRGNPGACHNIKDRHLENMTGLNERSFGIG